ncbi:MAG: type VI secretion system protein [Planctomycetia bacterium]|nr:type VI secretion system protein [Planctomycetia bacterium]
MRFLKAIGRGLKGLVALALPFGRRQATGHPALGVVFRILLLALVLVGLWLLNRYLELDRYVRAPLPVLREVWLPLLFLLFYALAGLGWMLWRTVGMEPDGSEFPDIDLAWDEAMAALAEAALDVREAPVFLVLGRPSGGERALFGAGNLKLQVKQVPRRPDTPLTVSAHQDAVYVTCAGASLLGQYATLLAGAPDVSGRPAAATVSTPAEAPPGAVAAGDAGEATDLEGATAVMVADDEEELPTAPGRPRSLLLKEAEEVERLGARLRYLCHRIARDRRPFCPINGILLLIPYACTGGDAEAKEAGSLCQRDLEAVREAFQVECPVFALVCDLERVPGFDEFLKFFPEGQRRRLLGQQLPLSPDLDAAGRAKMTEKGVQWVGDVLFPRLVYKAWGVDGADPSSGTLSTSPNVSLYEFLARVRGSQKRLGRILNRGVVMPAPGAPMLGGCAFAATGKDLIREQGFAAGVFRFLVENQNHVAWTADARQADADYRRWTALGYLGLVALVAAILVLGYVLWPRR